MIYLWIILGLIVLINVVGLLMPVRTTGRVVARLAASPQQVWDALQDPEAHPMSGKMCRGIETRGERDGLPTWEEDMGHGERVLVTTESSTAPHELVRAMKSFGERMSARWEYRLEPDGDGTRVHIDAITDLESGNWKVPLFRVMMRLGGGVRAGLVIQLKMIAATLGVSCELGD